jgi:hypothetical protein
MLDAVVIAGEAALDAGLEFETQAFAVDLLHRRHARRHRRFSRAARRVHRPLRSGVDGMEMPCIRLRRLRRRLPGGLQPQRLLRDLLAQRPGAALAQACSTAASAAPATSPAPAASAARALRRRETGSARSAKRARKPAGGARALRGARAAPAARGEQSARNARPRCKTTWLQRCGRRGDRARAGEAASAAGPDDERADAPRGARGLRAQCLPAGALAPADRLCSWRATSWPARLHRARRGLVLEAAGLATARPAAAPSCSKAARSCRPAARRCGCRARGWQLVLRCSSRWCSRARPSAGLGANLFHPRCAGACAQLLLRGRCRPAPADPVARLPGWPAARCCSRCASALAGASACSPCALDGILAGPPLSASRSALGAAAGLRAPAMRVTRREDARARVRWRRRLPSAWLAAIAGIATLPFALAGDETRRRPRSTPGWRRAIAR